MISIKKLKRNITPFIKADKIKTEVELSLGKQKVKLSSEEITFNDEKATIEIGNCKCSFPPYKNEHYFRRAIFEYTAKEPLDFYYFRKNTGYYEEYYGKPQNIRENGG